MRTYRYAVLIIAIITIVSAALVLADDTENEARKFFIRGMTALETAKNNTQLSKAIGEFKKATEIAPTMAIAWYNLALAQARVGFLKGAIESYQRYLALAPQAEDIQQVKDEIVKLEFRLESMERPNGSGKTREIANDDRFIAYDDGDSTRHKDKPYVGSSR